MIRYFNLAFNKAELDLDWPWHLINTSLTKVEPASRAVSGFGHSLVLLTKPAPQGQDVNRDRVLAK